LSLVIRAPAGVMTYSIISDLLGITFIVTIGNAQFLDVFCIFEYQKNK